MTNHNTADAERQRLIKAWYFRELTGDPSEVVRLAALFDLDWDALDRSVPRTDGWVSMDKVDAVIEAHSVLREIAKFESGVITVFERTMPERHWTALLAMARHWRRRLP
jgi:hypothetical protein